MATWQEVDRLVGEQKYEAASEQVKELLAQAREDGDEAAWARGLIRSTQLRLALHGYETGVRFLQEEEWPPSPRHHLSVGLFYGHALATYMQAYSWEIRKREEIAGEAGEDLKAWTYRRLVSEIENSYAAAFRARDEWGESAMGDLAAYIEPGTYPARLRGTLRDVVSYLWTDFLATTRHWSAKDSNELFRVDLEALLADAEPYSIPEAVGSESGETKSGEDIFPADFHPLEKVRAILADLEAWHGSRGQSEAALEARLQLLRHLRGSFEKHASDRALLRSDLEKRLATFERSLPWFSMGISLLAEMKRADSDDPYALPKARDLARQGLDPHPESLGAQRCRHLVEALEQPQMRLAAMASDGAQRRSIEITHANAKAIFLRAYPFDLRARLEKEKNPRWQPNHQDVQELIRQTPIARWSKTLPETPDLRPHRTFVTPPDLKPGAYVIVGSLREDFKEAGNLMSAALFIRSDLVLTFQYLRREEKFELTARDGRDGAPLEAEIEALALDWRQGASRLTTAKTSSEDGVAELDPTKWSRYPSLFFATYGEHQAILPTSVRGVRYPTQHGQSSLIYTDRSVYRPGQDILFKVIAYEGSADKFHTLGGTAIQVTLKDANGEEVAKQDLTTNEFGSASGRFTATPGRLLGGWSLSTSMSGWANIQIEEYKRPSFEVEVSEPTAALRLNEVAKVNGQADYYFGLPVSSGIARWRVSRRPYYPPWRWWIRPADTSSRVIAHGETAVGADGSFVITFTPEADERLADDPDLIYRYGIDVEVTDDGGETREASRSIKVGFQSLDASIETASPFTAQGETTQVEMTRRRLNGAAAPGGATYRVTRIRQPGKTPLPADLPAEDGLASEMSEEPYRTEGDRQRPRWNAGVNTREILRLFAEKGEGEEVAAGQIEHGKDGVAKLELDLPAGAYRLHYLTEDDFGSTIKRQKELIVHGQAPLSLPLLFLPTRRSVEVGEDFEALVHSGIPGQKMVLEIFQDEGALERREIVATGSPQIIKIPVEADKRGGFGVSLTALHDHQLMQLKEQITVPWSDRRLEVAFERFRDRLRPGAEETFSVVVRGLGEGGEMDATVDPSTLELLAYMYDRSLDIFATHDPEDPIWILPELDWLPYVESNLGTAPIVWNRLGLPRPATYPSLSSATLRFLSGWPIGGPGGRGGRMMMNMRTPNRARAMKSAPMAAPMAESAAESVAFDSTTETVYVSGGPEDGMEDDDFDLEDEAAENDAGSDPVRSNFAETAFWFPHLILGEDGEAKFEFTVPDSVTEWSVWAHALTKDLRSGHVEKKTRSVKDLLIRPYMPRFLREGDQAQLRLVVSNAGETPLSGTVDVAITDDESGADLLADFGLTPADVSDLAFSVEPGATTTLAVDLTAPHSPRPVAITARANAGSLMDGERRPMPILPSRLHLAQSRFAAVQGPGERTLHFADLAQDDDPSRENESLIVTLDGQLFGSVLRALPYLVDYPYKCTEQTLNRYLSTGILSSLYESYPSVGALGARLAQEPETPLEPWREEDPNRRLLLEETPWLQHARGGEATEGLLKVLDPEVAAAVRAKAIGELRQIQTDGGGFPWFPGGPPSPYMTLYTLQGFVRGLEFGLDVPKDMTVSAWHYLHDYWERELSRRLDQDATCCGPRVTFFAWLLWAYPDTSWTGEVFSEEDRRRILEVAARHWKELSPRLKGYLALALQRAGEAERAKLVWDSVMDSAKTNEDLGTYWAPEDRSWLWYNDSVESQAFALRVLMELDPEDARRHGLVQWLLLDKKLGHWKSTRATAEAVYGLAAYIQAEGTLDAEQRATVELGPLRQDFVFEPQEDGRRQIVKLGDEVETSMAMIEVENETKGLIFASATWHFATDLLPEEARGDFFTVERRYFKRVLNGEQWRLEPLAEGHSIAIGDQIEVQLSLRAKHAAEYVHLRDPRGAGFEPEDTDSGYSWNSGIGHYREIRDSGVNYFFEWLPAGEYDFRYRLRAATSGAFRVSPAELQSMYAPEFVAYSSGRQLRIEEAAENEEE